MHISPWEQRLELLEAALRDNPAFKTSREDIDRTAPYYTFETLQILTEIYENEEIIFLMGGDSLYQLPLWKEPEKILQYCREIGVMHRPGYEINMSELERVLPDGQILLVGRPGDGAIDLREAPAALGVPFPDLRRHV